MKKITSLFNNESLRKELGENGEADTGMSQVFIAIDPEKFGDENFQQNLITDTLNNFKMYSKDGDIRYPGEGVYKRRMENTINGIPIEKEIWEKILTL